MSTEKRPLVQVTVELENGKEQFSFLGFGEECICVLKEKAASEIKRRAAKLNTENSFIPFEMQVIMQNAASGEMEYYDSDSGYLLCHSRQDLEIIPA